MVTEFRAPYAKFIAKRNNFSVKLVRFYTTFYKLTLKIDHRKLIKTLIVKK